MSTEPGETTPWIKATRSDTSNQCVEMRHNAGVVELRDSKDPEGPALRHTKAQFAAWLDGAKRGDFDHLI